VLSSVPRPSQFTDFIPIIGSTDYSVNRVLLSILPKSELNRTDHGP
jgi:hypothetical protein